MLSTLPGVGAIRRHANAARPAPDKAKHAEQFCSGTGDEAEADRVRTS